MSFELMSFGKVARQNFEKVVKSDGKIVTTNYCLYKKDGKPVVFKTEKVEVDSEIVKIDEQINALKEKKEQLQLIQIAL